MSGNPAFQGSPAAFQGNAFQSGVILVSSDYSLGHPVFATPTSGANYHFTAPAYSLQGLSIPLVGRTTHALNVLSYTLQSLGFTSVGPLHFNYHFTTAAYSIGRPAFATPTLFSSSNLRPVTANPYSLGRPIFATPTLRQVNQKLTISAYSLGNLSYAPATVGTNYRLFSNAWSLSSLEFDRPRLTLNYHLTGTAAALGPLAWAPVGPIVVNYVFATNAYSLSSPQFALPRLQWDIVRLDLPPTYLTQVDQAVDILVGMLNTLLSSIPPSPTDARDLVRVLINTLRSNAEIAIRGNTLGTQLRQIFAACIPAGATFAGIDATRQFLMSQVADSSPFSQTVFRNALVMTLALQSQIVATMIFRTQTEIQNMLLYMRDAFDAAKALGIDEIDVTVYQTLNAMSGALINHMARTELQLPRFMTYASGASMPSLYLANRIYADETPQIEARATEIENENGVVHPAFCPRTLRVLSKVQPGIATQ